jgi:hypothetical protein
VIAPLPHYRGQPSPLIATIVEAMARNLALPEVEIDRIRTAALLHDVGKVAVPVEILEKPSALTSAEWRAVVQHPRIGQVILEQAAALRDAVPIILHHHERYSGHGYPFGLRGTDIPLGARIAVLRPVRGPRAPAAPGRRVAHRRDRAAARRRGDPEAEAAPDEDRRRRDRPDSARRGRADAGVGRRLIVLSLEPDGEVASSPRSVVHIVV